MPLNRSEFDANLDTLDEAELAALLLAARAAYPTGVKAGYKKLAGWGSEVPGSSDDVFQAYSSDLADSGGRMIDGSFVAWRTLYNSNFRESLWRDIQTVQASGIDATGAIKDAMDKRRSHAKLAATAEVMYLERMGEFDTMSGAGVDWYYLMPGKNPCHLCAPYVGRAYRSDMLPYYPPRHNYCCCSLIPIFPGNPLLNTVSAATGIIAASDSDFDYDEFYEDI